MLRLSIEAVASQTGLAEGTVKRAEKADGYAPITNANAKLIMGALEAQGVIFLPAGEFGPGVCQRLDASSLETALPDDDEVHFVPAGTRG